MEIDYDRLAKARKENLIYRERGIGKTFQLCYDLIQDIFKGKYTKQEIKILLPFATAIQQHRHYLAQILSSLGLPKIEKLSFNSYQIDKTKIIFYSENSMNKIDLDAFFLLNNIKDFRDY